ncbi:cellulose biosynthesis cyclic di-GMP-binding regulatory protein BcsB [Rhodoblastus acidophilus]|nr:cellulose biosynthesis cyclic di-GMP-binding regulatory protein BcsB [Rhodoblastus acidophilus]
MSPLAKRVFCALASAVPLLAVAAQAQSLLAPLPMSQLPLIGSAPSKLLAGAPRPSPPPPSNKIDYTPVSAILDPHVGEAVLRHLPNNIQGFRLQGETGASEWPIYLSETQALRKLSFRIGYLSAVSVMPEASTLTVFINDVAIGETHINAPNKAEQVDFAVPPELLRPGFNAVRVSVDQRHRVDCSLAATNELWTQIDPSRTGLLIPGGDAGVRDIADIPALPPDAQGALPIRAVLPGRTSPANIERMIRAVQFISTHGRFEQPSVDVGPMASGDYGVNLVVGLYEDVAKLADLDGDLSGLGRVDGPRLALLAATPSRRATIVITGLTEDDVNRALADFAREPARKGSPEGLRAAQSFPGYRIGGGQTLRLRDLGLHSQEFSGRFFRAGFNIVLPADFYPANYAKVPLNLSGGYVAGLSRGAQILISINGRDAVSAPLPANGGGVFKDKTLPLPLGFFRPGLNRIEIAAQVPTPEDLVCDPVKMLEAKKRFLLLDSTQLRLPDLARIGRAPDLAVTATGGFPFIGAGKQPKMFMPAPDRNSIAAAATLAGRMAASAGRPIDFRFTLTPPPEGSGATLAILDGRTLDDETAKKFGVDGARLREAWRDRFDAKASEVEEKLSDFDSRARARLVLQKNLPAACHMSKRAVAAASAAAPPEPPPTMEEAHALENDGERDLVAAWARDGVSEVFWRRTGEAISAASDGLTRITRGAWNGARHFAGGGGEERAAKRVYRPANSLVIAQVPLGAGADDIWTLVTAPNTALLAESVNCLSDPRVWRQVEGRVAALDASNGEIAHLEPGSLRFVATQPLSVSNLRLIAASWLSLNSLAYVGLALLAALLFGAATFAFVRSVGRRQECD